MQPSFVLVHGAWHGGWCWRRVVPLLRAAGHRVSRPTLTGVGERAHLAGPAVSLETHIEDIARHIEAEELHRVVLVGHSYAGMVITGVADRIPERLAALVYLDAFVPESGKAMLDYIAPERRALMMAEGERLGALSCMPLERLGLSADEDCAWVGRRITTQPYATFTQPLRLKPANPAREALPRTYIYCSGRPTGSFDQFSARLRGDAQWRYAELHTGHDAMVTDPHGVTRLLTEAAAALPAA